MSDSILRAPEIRDAAASAPRWSKALGEVVGGLRHSREVSHNIRHGGRLRQLPSPRAVRPIVDDLAAALFPSHYGKDDLDHEMIDDYVGATLGQALTALEEQVRREVGGTAPHHGLSAADGRLKAEGIVGAFAAQLPAIRNLIVSDLMAAYAGDPAATSFPEIMLSYPGILASLHYRLARALYLLDATLVARLIAQIAHSRTAIDIHPGASIGQSFFIDHGTGVVIGETAVIGDRVRLYQAVTLGAKKFPADESGRLVKGKPRHPVVEDDVVIYAGATILGRITIGHHSIIGGNVWLTESVPPHTSVTQARMRNADC